MSKKILLYAINNTFQWWKFVGEYLSRNHKCTVITEHQTSTLYSLKKRFYFFYNNKKAISKFSNSDIKNIIARCRVLRNIDNIKAKKMVIAYENVFEELFYNYEYNTIISFPIDRYPMDVMNRVAKRYNIEHLEITVSVLNNFTMLLKLGEIVSLPKGLNKSTFDHAYKELVDPNYEPEYVQSKITYNFWKWIYIYCYQNFRSIAFKFIMLFENDPLSLHYLDSQMYLKHKVKFKDIQIFNYIDNNYVEVIKKSKKTNVLIALQLFPEASIDYWVRDMGVVKYEDFLIHVVKSFSKKGYNVLLKDHPLQFGFRTIELIKKAKLFDNVYLLPYESDINYIMNFCQISFTTTGTIGLQSAIKGLVSFVTPSYYSNNTDFKVYKNRDDFDFHLKNINPAKLDKDKLKLRKKRIITHIHKTSFKGSILSFFQKKNFLENKSLVSLVENLRIYLNKPQ